MPARTKTRKKPARAKASTAAGRKRASTRANGRPAATRPKPKAARRKPAKRSPAKGKTAKRGSTRRAAARKTKSRTFRIPRPSLGADGWRRRIVVGVVVLGALAAGYFGWLRDSALVAVRDVKVEGVSGTQQKRIEKALTRAAEEMTTLHVREGALAAAAASFPDVKSVSAAPSLPSGLTVTVVQRRPALLARAKSETIAVAGDGALLPGIEVPKGEELPAIDVSALPESGRLEGSDLEQALVVGAAPEPLRPLIEKVSFEQDEGVVAILKGGLPVHFGTGGRAKAKWAAASAVLADPKLKRLTYVDVRVPERAAAGGSAPPPAPEEEPAAVTPDAPSTEALPTAEP